MAQIIEGDADTFNAIALGEMHPGTENFLRQQWENTSNALNEQGQAFIQATQSLYDRLAQSRAGTFVRAARRAVSSLWDTDTIRPLVTIEQQQWAKPTMQRWIMAEPEVRRRYYEQTIEGYNGSYVDPTPGDIGETHKDYRIAMEGWVDCKDNPEDDEPEWSCTQWFDEQDPEDEELDVVSQSDIHASWAAVRYHLRKNREDPTSVWGAEL